MNKSALQYVLDRCDWVAIERGVLVFKEKEGCFISQDWIDTNQERILIEISRLMDVQLFQYKYFTPGKFKMKYSGLALQFSDVVSEVGYYAIFNVILTRSRDSKNGKKGDKLPKGRFKVPKNSKFMKFWKRTSLKVPPRRTSFHDYMGNLKPLVFTGKIDIGERINKDSLKPYEVKYDEIKYEYERQIILESVYNKEFEPNNEYTNAIL